MLLKIFLLGVLVYFIYKLIKVIIKSVILISVTILLLFYAYNTNNITKGDIDNNISNYIQKNQTYQKIKTIKYK